MSIQYTWQVTAQKLAKPTPTRGANIVVYYTVTGTDENGHSGLWLGTTAVSGPAVDDAVTKGAVLDDATAIQLVKNLIDEEQNQKIEATIYGRIARYYTTG